MAGVHGSRTHPRPLVRPRNRFEDGGSHRAPSTPAQTVTGGTGSHHAPSNHGDTKGTGTIHGMAAGDQKDYRLTAE